jgi:hypothetical protein
MITEDKFTPLIHKDCYTIREKSIITPTSEFKIARYRFSCLLCGTVVKTGDICIDQEGMLICTNCLPEK